MKLSYEWLSELVDLVDVTPAQAAELLTMAGIEVGEVTIIDVSGILVGRIISQEPHPKSRNPLWVHQVDLGGRTEQIIAGAPNAVPGSLVPVALPGTTVPSGRFVRPGLNIAGIAGNGMLCSAAELRLGDDHSGIMILESGRPGQDLAELFPPEAVLDAEVTSNRPDCLAHLGVARELGALLGRPLERDFMPPFTGGVVPPGTDLVEVAIEAPELCSRYIGAVVTGVQVGASPRWLRRRLRAVGLRPINNVVDVTNYVLLEYGQPLHAFDLQKLAGPAVRVRRARPGDRITTLDGVERGLSEEMLVIADRDRPQAVAGVIGGLESAVTETTVDVLLEAANFEGPNVRATARALGLRTEASSRFEKNLPAELALAGARRAAQLLVEVGGGKVHVGWPDVYPRPQQPVRVHVRPDRIDARLGVHVPLEESERILRALDFQVRILEDGSWDVLAPVFRLDVTIPEDLSEEIGRIFGYEKIPATLPGRREGSWRAPEPSLERRLDRVREVFAGAGLTETVNPALVPMRLLERLGVAERAPRIENALSEESNALRTTLLVSLLEVAVANQDREGAGAYELAKAFLKPGGSATGQPEEPIRLGAVLLAGADPESGRKAFLRLKSILERIAAELGVPALVYQRGQANLLHPGRTAAVSAAGRPLGHIGEIHPAAARELDLERRVAALEIDILPFLEAAQPQKSRPLPRFPAVERDLAVVVPEDLEAGRLLAAIEAAAGALLESVTAFDEYRGAQVGEGSKSVAFALTFRSPERTLTDAEVDLQMDAVRIALTEELGARFRT